MPDKAIGTRTDRRVPSVSAQPDRNSKLPRRRLAVLSPGLSGTPSKGKEATTGKNGTGWDVLEGLQPHLA
jgi:hypothetical protein